MTPLSRSNRVPDEAVDLVCEPLQARHELTGDDYAAVRDALSAITGGGPTWGQLVPEDQDMVILIRRHGRAAVAYVRRNDDEVQQMPIRWETRFAPEGGLIPIGGTVRFGWTTKQWKDDRKDEPAPEASAHDRDSEVLDV